MTTYQRLLYLGITLIALGVVLSTTLSAGSIGTVMIAVGGLFFIAGMARKRQADQTRQKSADSDAN